MNLLQENCLGSNKDKTYLSKFNKCIILIKQKIKTLNGFLKIEKRKSL